MVVKKERLLIRLTSEEKQAFEKAADHVGLSLSSWVRQSLRRSAITDLEASGEKPEFLK